MFVQPFYSNGMFIKVTSSGPRRYVQLVEAYRDDQGRPKQRTVATLGRLDQLNSELESVIAGLLRVTGNAPLIPPVVPAISFAPSRTYGSVIPLNRDTRRRFTYSFSRITNL